MDCLFCNIVAGQVPAEIVFDNEEILAFRDIDPQARMHILIIPKRHMSTINDSAPADAPLIGRLILTARQLAIDNHCSDTGYRLVFNVNQEGGQAVYHIHLHLLGGRQLAWPPG